MLINELFFRFSPDTLLADQEQIIHIRLSLTPPEHEFTGVVHATKCTVIQDDQAQLQATSSDYVKTIRSNLDDVSLDQSMTSTMRPKQRPHPSSEDDYVRISCPQRTDHEDVESEDEDGHDSDHSSQASDDYRFVALTSSLSLES